MKNVCKPDISGSGYQGWHRIGAIGVTCYWNNYKDFYAWLMSNLGDRPLGCFLTRIDTTGNFEPGNLKWKSGLERGTSKSRQNTYYTANGETMCLSEWCRKLKMNEGKVRRRLDKGMTMQDIYDL